MYSATLSLSTNNTYTPNIHRIALEPFDTTQLQGIVASALHKTGLTVFQNVTQLTLTTLNRPTAFPTALPTGAPSGFPLRSLSPTTLELLLRVQSSLTDGSTQEKIVIFAMATLTSLTRHLYI